MPVIYAAGGNGHVFVDASGRPRRRRRDRGQLQGPATLDLQCGGDAARARRRRQPISCRAFSASCANRGWSCGWTGGRARWRARWPTRSPTPTEEDWATEYHALILAVKVVDSVDEAIEHVNRYGSGHSEAIVTGSTESAQAFTGGVDAACVYVERVHPVHRRRGVRHGRRDRQLDPEAARPRPDRAARAHHLQVRRRGIRAGPRVGAVALARRSLRRSLQPAAPGPPRVCPGGAGPAGLDRVVFVPVGQAPHRELEDDPGRRGAPRDGRAGRCAATSASRSPASRSTARGPPTRPTRSRLLRAESPDDELFLILGGDQAAALPSWHEPEKVLERATVAVVRAHRLERAARIGIKLARLPRSDRVRYLDMPLIQISSTAIRRRVREGRPIRYSCRPPVEDYIGSHDALPGREGRRRRARERRTSSTRPRWPSGSPPSPPTARRSTSA